MANSLLFKKYILLPDTLFYHSPFPNMRSEQTSTGKNSSRPAIMQNEKTIFEKEENAA